MKLPVIRLAGDERWDCQGCGICCRGSIVPLSNEDWQKIRDQHWENDPEFAGQRFVHPHPSAESGKQLARRSDGCCVFLTAEGRCRVHEKFGFESKPLFCRLFPLQLIPREKHAVLTLRRACPTAAADLGRPLTEHLPEIQRLVSRNELKVELTDKATLDQPSWQRAQCILGAADRILNDQRFPPVRRVVHALLLAKLLERAKLARLDDRKLAELVDLLEPNVISESKPYFVDRRPPTFFSGLLFRLTAAEYLRLHPDYRAPQGFWRRGKLLRSSWKMLHGRGVLPRLHPTFPTASFATLEQPLAEVHPALIDPEILRPIERYLSTSATSYQYALANRSRWSIVQSIRGLALTLPIALYLLRWAAAGREPNRTDAANIVCALDRGQGYALLAGARQRLVLGLLAGQGDLERLVVWYAR